MRWASRWRQSAAIALSVCWCLFTVACAGTTTTEKQRWAPPSFFDWNYNASVGARTPQAAYAHSAHFVPCRKASGVTSIDDQMTTSPDQSVTWLFSGSRVGVAYLRATCRNAFHGNYAYRSFLILFKGRQDTWYIDQFQRQVPFPPTEDPTPTFASSTSSLADLFPADAYRDWGPMGPQSAPVSLLVRTWFSLTPRDYVVGLLNESATRPPEATETTVGGLPGWVTEAGGMAAIVAARPDKSIFVFAGTGSVSEIEALAAHVLPRADETVGGPPPTPTAIPTAAPTSTTTGGR